MTKTRISGTIEKFLASSGLDDDTFLADLVTGALDLEGDRTLASGATPPTGTIPLLWNHDPACVIGKATYRIVGDKVKLTCTLIPEGTSEAGNLARVCTKGDFGVGVSAGFQPIDVSPIPGGRGKIYKKYHLLEASVVSVPADQNARITARNFDAERAARVQHAVELGARIRREDAVALAPVAPTPTRAERIARARELAPPDHSTRKPMSNAQAYANRADKHAREVMELQQGPNSRAGRIAAARALARND